MRERWEYKVQDIKPDWLGSHSADNVQKVLDAAGQEGWELVNIIVRLPTYPVQAVFKRRQGD